MFHSRGGQLSLKQNADTRYTETLHQAFGNQILQPSSNKSCFRRELFYCKEEQSGDFSSLPRSALVGLPTLSAKSGSQRGKLSEHFIYSYFKPFETCLNLPEI